jgi:hypothetical protein
VACSMRCGVLGLAILLMMVVVGCGAAEPSQPARGAADVNAASAPKLLPPGNVPRFRFRALDGREVSSDVALGRNTVVAFLATFDWASQAQARFVSGIERNHKPRTNCYAVVVEQPENEPLVASFVETLGLRFPVAHVTSPVLAKTALGVRTVPTVIVLDSGGNVVWRSLGLATEDTLREVLRAVEARGSVER